MLVAMHRRSQDFLWGHVFLKKLMIFLVVVLSIYTS